MFVVRDVFGVGGYEDTVATRLTQGELNAILHRETGAGNPAIPEVYMALRRRARLLRDNMMYIGPFNAFADYFPPWGTRPPAASKTDCSGLKGAMISTSLQVDGVFNDSSNTA